VFTCIYHENGGSQFRTLCFRSDRRRLIRIRIFRSHIGRQIFGARLNLTSPLQVRKITPNISLFGKLLYLFGHFIIVGFLFRTSIREGTDIWLHKLSHKTNTYWIDLPSLSIRMFQSLTDQLLQPTPLSLSVLLITRHGQHRKHCSSVAVHGLLPSNGSTCHNIVEETTLSLSNYWFNLIIKISFLKAIIKISVIKYAVIIHHLNSISYEIQ
jgi:hypothetical protein